MITFTFEIFPNLPMFGLGGSLIPNSSTVASRHLSTSVDWSNFLYTNDLRMTLTDNSFSSSSGQFDLSYHFNETIQFEDVVFVANMSSVFPGNPLLSQIVSSNNVFKIVPNNNIAATLCDRPVCTAKDQAKTLFIAMEALSYLALLLSLFSSKIVGLELFGVLQLSFFVLSDYNNVNVFLTGILEHK